jgi:hypothetical protein
MRKDHRDPDCYKHGGSVPSTMIHIHTTGSHEVKHHTKEHEKKHTRKDNTHKYSSGGETSEGTTSVSAFGAPKESRGAINATVKKPNTPAERVANGLPDAKRLKSGGMANGGQWIQNAIKKPGALHRELGVPVGHKIPMKMIKKAEHSSDQKLARRARLADTLKHMHRPRTR